MRNVKDYKEVLLSIFVVTSILFLTIGFALYNQDLVIQGKVEISAVGKVEITKVELDMSAQNTLNKYGGLNLDANGQLSLNYHFAFNGQYSQTDFNDTYIISVTNNSFLDYTYTGFILNTDTVYTKGNKDTAGAIVHSKVDRNNVHNTLVEGDTLKPGETKTIAIVLTITVGAKSASSMDITGNGNATSSIDNTGEILGSTSTKEIDLQNKKERECFQVNIINTYKYTRTFTLSSSNTNFDLVDSSGNSLQTFSIGAPSDTDSTSNNKSYDICIQTNENSSFLSDTAKTNIVLTTTNLSPITVGSLTVKVEINEIVDVEIPEISDVVLSVNKYDTDSSSLIIDTSWKRTDVGGTNITNYHVLLYDNTTNTLLKDYNTQSDITSYTIILNSDELANTKTDMVTNNHDYMIKVYGEDEAGNTGKDFCENSTNNYCVSSSTSKLKWEFNIDTSGLNNISLETNSSKKAYINNTYTTNLVANTNYSLPGTITVKMGNTTLTANTDYNYSSAGGGSLEIIKPVTDDITISGTGVYSGGICLVAGTKIKMANGTYKNIEDVKYDDLIQSYSYDLGRIVYEYPIWIEKEGTIDHYQKATFSDGTILETVGPHGIFSKDANQYVSVLDRESFHIGTNVIKLDGNNKLITVQVVDIEDIHKTVHFYHVEATYYHNIIANNLLTTDPLFIISNMFPFNDNLTWTEERKEFLAKNDLFYYEDWKHLFSKHLFYGLRMPETKVLYNKGVLDIDVFDKVLNSFMLEPNKSSNGKNVWQVTTSDDLLNNSNGISLEEGSFYELKEPMPQENKTFVGWYNTSNNKYYNVKDKVEVIYGMYFEAIWK